MRAPVELLVFTCLLVGIFPAQVVGAILAAAALPVVGGKYSLAIWHGLNAPMIMSLIAMSAGVLLYLLLRNQLRRGRFRRPPLVGRLDGKRLFESVLVLKMRLAPAPDPPARHPTPATAVVPAGIGRPGRRADPDAAQQPELGRPAEDPRLHRLRHPLAAGDRLRPGCRLAGQVPPAGSPDHGQRLRPDDLFSAPDLALTQLVVEVVTTVLILLGLRWLPRRIEEVSPLPNSLRKARIRRLRDLLLSVLVGGGMALLSYAMLTRQTPNDISSFYLSRALPEGGGSNVVNVMLVDFRGFDTLGEITVLVATALAIFALLRRFRPPRESLELPNQQRLLASDVVTDLVNPRSASDTALGFMMVPAVLVRLLLPIALVVSMYLFMRGHNQPGGGFVAGLVMSVAFILQYMVAGTQWVEAQMSLRPLRWMGTGLLFATLTGLGAMAFGYPFLTTHTAHLHGCWAISMSPARCSSTSACMRWWSVRPC